MAIELILGAPGGGKSYTAVRNYLPEALKAGRRVVTNLPLQLNAIAEKYGDEAVELITFHKFRTQDFDGKHLEEVRDRIEAGEEGVEISLFGVTWKADQDRGPILIIDEAGDSLGQKMTTEREQYLFRYHRHAGLDMVLIAQAATYVDMPVRKTCDRFYHTHNNRLRGIKSFTLQPIEISEGVPISGAKKQPGKTVKYEDEVFALYKSRTMGGGNGDDAKRVGVKAWWRHWIFYLIAIMFVSLVVFGVRYWVFGRSGDAWDAQARMAQGATTKAIGGSVTPSATVSPPSAEVLVGVQSDAYAVRHMGQVFWSDDIPFEIVPGRCAVLMRGREVFCGERIPAEPRIVGKSEEADAVASKGFARAAAPALP